MKPQDVDKFIEHARRDELLEAQVWLNSCSAMLVASVRAHQEKDCIPTKPFSSNKSSLSAKDYFSSRVLAELLAASVSLIESGKEIIELSYNHTESPWFFQAMRNSRASIEKGASRRLAELLTLLILFQPTNEEQYFKHFLLLTEFDQLLGRQSDEKDFFGKAGSLISTEIEERRAEIQELEKMHPSLESAWYLKKGLDIAKINKPGNIFCSFRQLFMLLEGKLSHLEKLALGFTYGGLYSSASRSIHFTPTDIHESAPVDALDILAQVMIRPLLSFNSLKRINTIAGRTDQKIQENLNSLESQFSSSISRLYTEFRIHDLVLVEGHLAEITETITGRFGYRAYKLQFVKTAPAKKDTTYLACQISLIVSQERFTELFSKTDQAKNINVKKFVEDNWHLLGTSYWEALKALTPEPQ